MKYFRVEKQDVPNYGQTQVLFIKYFKARNKEALEAYLHNTFGKPSYYRYDEIESVYLIEEIKVSKIPDEAI